MRKRIPISEARSRLSRLLKELQRRPDLVYEITVRDLVVGELRAPSGGKLVRPGSALLKAVERMKEIEPEVEVEPGTPTAREHDLYLYARPRKRSS
jgi:hypothetical protein